MTNREQYNFFVLDGSSVVKIYCESDKEAIQVFTKQFLSLVDGGYNNFTFILEREADGQQVACFTI